MTAQLQLTASESSQCSLEDRGEAKQRVSKIMVYISVQ